MRNLKIFTNSLNKEIPKDVIIFSILPVFGWFGFWDDKWYGDYVRVENDFPEKDTKETIEILLEQIKVTKKKLEK